MRQTEQPKLVRRRRTALIASFAIFARVVPAIGIVGFVTTANPPAAGAHSVAQVDLGVSMTPDTQEMLTARGTGIQSGDVLEYVVEFTPVDNGSLDGPGGYVTFYPPAGTQVVGTSVVQPQGTGYVTIPVSPPGGIPGDAGGTHAPYAAPFDAGDPYDGGAWEEGTLPQFYGDTGIFYSTDANTAKYVEATYLDGADPDTTLLTATNGYLIEPSACGQLQEFIGDPPDCRTHNLWDADSVAAWGGTANTAPNVPTTPPHSTQANLGGNRGRTAYLAGSPVAGPDTFYQYDYSGQVGPWQRISYPGSTIGTGPPDDPAIPNTSYLPTGAGITVDQANPLPTNTTAVRWAVGGLTVGELKYVKVDLKVLPVFNSTACNPVDAEVFGGDAGLENPGKDNAWRYHVPAPANGNTCLVIHKDAPAQAAKDDTVTYTITVTNVSALSLTNVVVQDFVPASMTFVSASPPEESVVGSTVTWPAFTLPAGASTTFDITVTVDAAGNLVNSVGASSDQTPPAKSGAQILVGDYAAITHTKSVDRPIAQPSQPVVYTVAITNTGDAAATSVSLTDTLNGYFVYEPGTTLIDGSPAPDPAGTNPYTWPVGTVGVNTTKTIEFEARLEQVTALDSCYFNEIYSVTWSEPLVYGPQSSYAADTAEVCVPPFQIGDYIWEDLNGNGIQDSGEPGIEGVEVSFQSAGADTVFGTTDDVVEATTLSGSDGLYTLVAPTGATYRVGFETPPGMTLTAQDLGSDDTDSDIGPAGFFDVVVPFGGIDDLDLGAYTPITLGDFIWEDLNGNGVQDLGEPGVDGAVVSLTGAGPDGAFSTADDYSFADVTTPASGAYSFGNLAPGEYQVVVDLTGATLSGLEFAPANNGGDLTVDSDFVDSDGDGISDPLSVTLVSGVSDTNIDAGAFLTSSIGDFVWNDLNGNGVLDGEPGLDGVTVTLLDASLTPIASQTTTAGAYSFTDLAPGNYTVQFTKLPSMSFTTPSSIVWDLVSGTPIGNADAGMKAHLPEVDIQKTGPASAIVGETITYTYTVSHDVSSDDSAIASVTLVDADAGVTGITLISGDDGDGLLEAAETWVYTGSYTVAADDPDPLNSFATVDGIDVDGDALSDTDGHAVAIDFQPQIDVVKSGPGVAAVGDVIVYVYSVSHGVASDGSGISSVVVTDVEADVSGIVLVSGDTNSDGILQVSETWVYNGTYTVESTDGDPVNTLGVANGFDRDGEGISDADGHPVDVSYNPVIDIQKTGPATAAVGDAIVYTYSVTHHATSDSSGVSSVVVSDVEVGVSGIVLVSGDINSDGVLQAGETWVYTGDYTVQPDDPDPINTLGTVDGVDLDFEPVTDSNGHPVAVSYNPVIDIQKTGPATALVGESIVYTYTVTHHTSTDGSAISSLVVTDAEPDVTGITLDSGDTNSDGILQDGETWVYTGNYTIKASDPDPINTSATVDGVDLDSEPVNDTNGHSVNINRQPAMAVSKTGPATAIVGELVTYNFAVSNDNIAGDGTALQNVIVTDDIAGIAAYLSGDTDSNGQIDLGETWQFSAPHTITAADPTTLTNTVTVRADDLDSEPVTPATNTHNTAISGYNPVIDIQKSGPATATVGQTITYTYTISHDPSSDGSDIDTVLVSDAEADVTAITLISGDTNTDGILESGETWTYTADYTIKPGDSDPTNSLATVNAADLDGDPVTDTNTHLVAIEYNPVIDIQKSGPATATVGQTITYTYTISHDPSSDGSDIDTVLVSDAEADVTAITLISGDDGDGILESGETWIYTGTYTVKLTDPDPFDSIATVNGSDQDGDAVTDTNNHPVAIDYQPELAITKNGPAAATVGQSITYNFLVTNDAAGGDGSAIGNLTVTDDIAGSATYSAGDSDLNGLLDVGETWQYSASYTVAATDPTLITNTVIATGDDLDAEPIAAATDSHGTAISGYDPVVDVVKSGPGVAAVGDVIVYVYSVSHGVASDGSGISSVVVTDVEADVSGIVLVSGDTNSDGILQVSETWVYNGNYTVKADDPDPIDTTGHVDGLDADGEAVSDFDGHPVAVSYNPVIDIQKIGPASANVGDNITYTYTVSHDPASDGSNMSSLVVSDAEVGLSGIVLVSGDINSDGVLQASETWVYAGGYTVQPDDPDPINTLGTVDGVDLDFEPVTDSNGHPVAVSYNPVIEIQKTGPATALVGESIVYTYTVTHHLSSDSSAISSLVLADAEPDVTGITLDSGDANSDGILQDGEIWVYTGNYIVKASDPDPFNTSATVDGIDLDSEPVNDSNGHAVNIDYQPAIAVSKSGPAAAVVGELVTYSFAVSNDSVAGDGTALKNVIVSDDIAGIASYLSGDSDSDGQIDLGETWQFSAPYTVTADDPVTLTNTVSVRGDDLDSEPVTPATDTHNTAISGYEPVMNIDKTGPATATVGETITYTYTVSHDPSSDGSDIDTVAVTDAEADVTAITLVSGDTNTDGVLQTGETWVYTADYTIKPGDSDPTSSLATVSASDLDGDVVTDTDSHPVAIEYNPVIDIQKSGPATATVGETITYTYTVSHDPSSDGSDIDTVAVTDAEADVTAITLVSGDTNTDGILQTGETWVYTADYTVKLTDPDPFDSFGTVNGSDLDGDAITDTDTHTVVIDYLPGLDIEKSGPANAAVGETITYTYTVSHDPSSDNSDIGTITVTDAEADLTAITLVSGDTNTDGILQSGETWVYTADYTVKLTDPDPTNTASTVNGLDLDGEPVTDSNDHPVDIDYQPEIVVAKTGPVAAAVGDTITYTYTVTHDVTSDGSDVTGVTMVDIEADVTGISLDSGDDGDGILESGESWVYTGTYVIKPTDPDPIYSLGRVDGFDLDGEPLSNIDGHFVWVEFVPVINIEKSGPAAAEVGETITYTYTVTHDGASDGSDISGVTVSDAEPDVTGINLDSGDTNSDGILQLSETWIYTGSYTIKATDSDPLTSIATGQGSDRDGEPTSDTATHLVDVGYNPVIDIQKAGPASANVGDTITYTYSISHDPASDGSGIYSLVISDAELDVTGLALVSGDDGDGVLEAGETWVYSGDYTIKQTDTDPVNSVGTIDGQDGDAVAVSDSDGHLVSIDFIPAIAVVKSGPATANIGETVTYNFSVTNDGTGDGSPIGNLTVDDDLAGLATYASGDSDTDGLVDTSETWLFTANRLITPSDPTTLTNTVTVTGDDLNSEPVPPATDIHDTTISGYEPVIDVRKTGPATASVGDTITYTYTVTHHPSTDGSDISAVVVTDADPDVLAITLNSGDDGDSILEAGETWVYTGTYTIKPTDPDPVDTVATVSALDVEGDPIGDTNSHAVAIEYNPVIDLQKSGPATGSVGETITYTYTVSHHVGSDNSDIDSITISDAEADVTGITLVSGDTNTDGILQASETWTYTGDYTIKPDDLDPTSSLATVNGSDHDSDAVTDTNSHAVAIEYNPVIDVQKTGPVNASVGETITYSYTISHDPSSDNSNIDSVVVTDGEADVTGITLDSGDDGDGVLEPGETWIYTGTYTVKPTDPDPLNTIGSVTASDIDGDPVSDNDDHPVNLGFAPVLAVAKSGPANASVGDLVTYTFDVTNDNVAGDGTAVSDVGVTDNVAGAASYISGDTDGDTLLEIGEIWLYGASYTIQASDPTTLTNTVTVIATDSDGDPTPPATDSHDTIVGGYNPVIEVRKSGPASAAVGESIAYTYTVNHDPTSDNSDLFGVTVTDAEADVTGITLDSGDDGDGVLEPGETWIYTGSYTIKATDPDPTNTLGTVTASDFEGDSIFDTDGHPVSVSYAPFLAVTKSGPANANVGDLVTYTFLVTNDDVSGDGSGITNIAVSDDVAGAASYVSGDTDSDALLSVGETWVYQASYTIQASDPTILTNAVTVTADDLDSEPVPQATDSHDTAVAGYAPIIDIQKTGPASAAVGDSITYTYTVTHDPTSDGSDIAGLAVIDAEPDVTGITLDSGDDGDGILEPGETWIYTGSYTIKATDPDPTNTLGSVSGTDIDGDPISDTDGHPTAVSYSPAIDIQKTGPASAAVGDSITYTYTVTQPPFSDGSGIAGLSVTDAEPDVTAITLDSGDDGDGILEPGETWIYTGNYTIKATDPNPTNTLGTASGSDLNGGPISDSDGHPVAVSYAPAMQVTKAGAASALVGDTISYTFTITNDFVSGDGSPVGNVVVVDDIAGPGVYSSGDTDGDALLNDGESWEFTASYLVQSTDPTDLTNVVAASGDDNDGDTVPFTTDTHTTTITGYNPAIQIVKSGPSDANVGATVLYSYEVTNETPGGDGSPINTVSVTDSIAGSASYMGGDSNSNGLLEVGETWLYQATYTVQPTDPDPLVSPATVDGFDPEGDPVTDSDTHSLNVGFGPVMALTKSGPANAAVGDTVTYTFELINDGTAGDGSPISTVSLSDDIAGPAALTSGDGGTIGVLEVGEIWIFEASYTIDPSDPDPLVNTATATGTDPDDAPVSSADAHSTAVSHQPELNIAKDGPATANTGDTITYTYTVTHDASSDLTDISAVVVSDADPDVTGMTLISGDTNNDGTLQATESWIYEASYTVTFDDPDPLVSVGTVDGVDLDAEPVTPASDDHLVSVIYAPEIDVQKAGPPTADVGETITYTYTVTHDVASDGSDISLVTVSDADPAVTGITLDSGDVNGDGILQADETWLFTGSYTVAPSAPSVINTVGTADGQSRNGAAVSDGDGHDVSINFAPTIDIFTDGPIVGHVGDDVNYTYTVTNDGVAGDGSPITGVTVTGDVAGGASYVSGDVNSDGVLEVGETWIYEATYTIAAGDPDPLVNNGSAAGFDGDSDSVSASDPHSVDILNPAIAIEMTPASQQVLNGDTATYTVTVTNTGDATLSNVTVSNTQTPNCDYVVGPLAPGEVVSYTCDEIITSDVTTTSEVTGDDSTGLAVSDLATVMVEQVGSAIGVAESISGPVLNHGDGTYTLTYEIVVANGGDTQLDALYLTQDFTSTFAGVTGFTIDAVTSSDLTLNSTFDGSTDTNLLSGSDSLAVGANGTVRVTVTVTPGTELGPHFDQINASATPTIGPDVGDLSDSGTDPDPNATNLGAPGDSGGSNDPLPVTFDESPSVGIATAVTSNVDNGDGTYTLTYTYTVENDGDVDLTSLQVSDALAGSFADAENFELVSVTSSTLSIDPTYDGNTAADILDGSDTLTAGSRATIEVVVTVTPGAELGPYTEQATVEGTSPSSVTVSDTSNEGSDPDPGDNGPADDSEPTTVTFTVNYDLQLIKDIVDGPDNGRATWRITITNGGTVNSPAFDIEDVLAAQLTLVSASGANTTCSTSGQAVTCHHGGLAAGESVAIDVVTTFFAASGSTIANSATATSLGAAPEPIISNNRSSVSFTVGHALAFTGASTLFMIMLALMFIAVGWFLLIASRRRDSDPPAIEPQ